MIYIRTIEKQSNKNRTANADIEKNNYVTYTNDFNEIIKLNDGINLLKDEIGKLNVNFEEAKLTISSKTSKTRRQKLIKQQG